MQNYELVHSSRVKFIYPSEEEMGDLTFIVAERKTPASAASSSSRSFNVLLYLLVFQVKSSFFLNLGAVNMLKLFLEQQQCFCALSLNTVQVARYDFWVGFALILYFHSLYLLWFRLVMSTSVPFLQVQIPSSLPNQGSALSGHSPSVSGSALSPVLQPRTLILTSTDVFLLDEDYVSYPLPDFAKEPPSRWAHGKPRVPMINEKLEMSWNFKI